jgi:hypothetical protein
MLETPKFLSFSNPDILSKLYVFSIIIKQLLLFPECNILTKARRVA